MSSLTFQTRILLGLPGYLFLNPGRCLTPTLKRTQSQSSLQHEPTNPNEGGGFSEEESRTQTLRSRICTMTSPKCGLGCIGFRETPRGWVHWSRYRRFAAPNRRTGDISYGLTPKALLAPTSAKGMRLHESAAGDR